MPKAEHTNTLFNFLTQSRFRVWRYLLFIVAFTPMALSMPFWVFGSYAEIPISTIYWFGIGIFIAVILFAYFNISFLAPRYLSKGEYANYIIALLGLCFGFVVIKYIAEYQVIVNAGVVKTTNVVTILDWLSNLMFYMITIASSSITILFKLWIIGNNRIENLENKQLKNHIEQIKNCINPQFLYATLDYASEKVKSNPENTTETLFILSDLLSYQLYDSKREYVLLESDIKYIQDYLTLEQQNSKHKFTFTISVTGKTNLFIPPNLFMPLVEEIIKKQPNKLLIAFNTDNELIRFECIAPGIDLSFSDFKKVKQQLELLYSNKIILNKGVESIELQFKYAK